MKARIIGRIAIVSTLLFCCVGASAQRWSRRPYEFHMGVGFTNFMGDVCSPKDPDKQMWILPFRTTGYLTDAILKYNFKGRHSASFSTNFGYMSARETIEKRANYYYRQGIAFKTGFAELGFRYEFMFIKENERRNVYRKLGETKLKNFTMPSYLFAGIGEYFSYGNFYCNDEKGRERASEQYFSTAPVIMLGVGTKIRLERNLYVGFEFGIREAIGDKIDGAVGGKEMSDATPMGDFYKGGKFGKWIDQYQFVAVNIAFKMREKKNHMPNFKTIRR